ncbi:uncharacterized protein bora [Periplaneta americana]|uniref:uncharacterized protein bora n=1 Tax=Periplaneta americana TaxID=6978 RepID=UPI0037E969CB
METLNHGDYKQDYIREVSERSEKSEMFCSDTIKMLRSPVIENHNEKSPLNRLSHNLFGSQNTGLEDIREEDNEEESVQSKHNPPPCATFSILPSHTTPPSRQNKIRNPFDAALLKRLHLPIFSPSVFKRVVSPTQDMNQFGWTIDDVAKIQPAPIEECQSQEYEHNFDPEMEMRAQEAIDHYFCNTHVVCSPWGPQLQNKEPTSFVDTNNIADMQTTSSNSESDGDSQESPSGLDLMMSSQKEVSTQTTLTLPPELPPALEAALKPYFVYYEEQSECTEEGNLSTSTLRRKLFDHEEGCQQMSSPLKSCFSMQVKCKFDSPAHSGLLVTASNILCPSTPVINHRTYGTPLPGSKNVSSPEISPIGSITSMHHRNKSVTRLNFSSRMMSVDNSASSSPCLSPLGMAPIKHDDEHDMEQKSANFHMSVSSSAILRSQTPTPGEGGNETSLAMITSATSTPVKGKYPCYSEDVSMQSIHFKQTENNCKKYEGTQNFTIEGDSTSLNSFSLHSHTGNSLSCGSNMNSHDTGYQTANVSSINGGTMSGFSSQFSLSKNWTSIQFKSIGDKHAGCFPSDKYNHVTKGYVISEDNSLWLPGSRHIVSSTPTKICDKENF